MSRTRRPTGWEALTDLHDCAVCGAPTALELVDCADGHGEACPDRVCTGCGAVVVVGPVPLDLRASA